MGKDIKKYLLIILLTSISAFGCNMSMIEHRFFWYIIDWAPFIGAVFINSTIQTERGWFIRYLGVSIIFWLPALFIFYLILKH